MKDVWPSCLVEWNSCLPNPLFFRMVSARCSAGLTQIRSNPASCSVYIPPMDVPMMRSGCSFAHRSLSRLMAANGSTGRSGAITVACGSRRRIRPTVPLAPDDAKQVGRDHRRLRQQEADPPHRPARAGRRETMDIHYFLAGEQRRPGILIQFHGANLARIKRNTTIQRPSLVRSSTNSYICSGSNNRRL